MRPSLPTPDILDPPNGTFRSLTSQQLTQIVPTFRCREVKGRERGKGEEREREGEGEGEGEREGWREGGREGGRERGGGREKGRGRERGRDGGREGGRERERERERDNVNWDSGKWMQYCKRYKASDLAIYKVDVTAVEQFSRSWPGGESRVLRPDRRTQSILNIISTTNHLHIHTETHTHTSM